MEQCNFRYVLRDGPASIEVCELKKRDCDGEDCILQRILFKLDVLLVRIEPLDMSTEPKDPPAPEPEEPATEPEAPKTPETPDDVEEPASLPRMKEVEDGILSTKEAAAMMKISVENLTNTMKKFLFKPAGKAFRGNLWKKADVLELIRIRKLSKTEKTAYIKKKAGGEEPGKEPGEEPAEEPAEEPPIELPASSEDEPAHDQEEASKPETDTELPDEPAEIFEPDPWTSEEWTMVFDLLRKRKGRLSSVEFVSMKCNVSTTTARAICVDIVSKGELQKEDENRFYMKP